MERKAVAWRTPRAHMPAGGKGRSGMGERKTQVAGRPRRAQNGSGAGARLVYEVYSEHQAELRQAALEGIQSDPELMRIVERLQAQSAASDAAEREARTRSTLRAGLLEGDWGPYTEAIRDSGETYAHAGLPFSLWSKVFTSVRSVFLDLLAEKADRDMRLFVSAADALGVFLDRTLSAVGDEYLKASQEIITRQQTAIRELSSPVLKVQP